MSADVKNMILARQVELTLRSLHIGGTLKGLYYLVYAVTLTLSTEEKTDHITKDLYPRVATAFHTTPPRVERDMRFAIRTCWDHDTCKAALSKMAGCTLSKRPSNSEFIDIVAFYLRCAENDHF